MTTEEEFLKKLLETFSIEADEHVSTITRSLIQLETGCEDEKEVIERIYREYHSLKGAARAVNLIYIEKICHCIEQLFAAFKNGELNFKKEYLDLCYDSVNLLNALLKLSSEEQENRQRDVITLIEKVKSSLLSNKSSQDQKTPPIPPITKKEVKEASKKPASEISSSDVKNENISQFQNSSNPEKTIRISQIKLEKLLLQVEELITLKEIFTGQKEQLFNLHTQVVNQVKKLETFIFEAHTKNLFKDVLDKQSAIISEGKEFLSHSGQLISSLIKDQENAAHFTKGLLEGLLIDMKRALLQPFSSLIEMFPKMTRDISKTLNKEVQLHIQGEDVEVDRRVLEEIKDPLTHMIRNAIDHGIENPDERIKKGKNKEGQIVLQISSLSGGQIEIKISDDGRGIDFAKVKEKAIKMGLINENAANEMTQEKIGELAFISGLSTSEKTSDLSGRGVGLSVVQEKIEKLGGDIHFESKKDEGTVFKLTVPLTLATSRGVHIRVQSQEFIIPTTHVKRIMRVRFGDLKTVETKRVIYLDGTAIAYSVLGELLGIQTNFKPKDSLFPVIIIGIGQRFVAFAVDEILKESEIFEKPLGKQLKRIYNFTSATILADGRVIPILDTSDLIKSAGGQITSVQSLSMKLTEKESRKSILIVEDSVTARTMLKNILENAGYTVKIAVDGAEAFTFLQKNSVDLVLTDIEMPRMNGFDLTKKIRSDEKLKELPVIICTTLASDEDKSKGIEVGANAYIEKSQFTQNNLVEIIKTFI